MFLQRVWVALLAIWIILTLQNPVTGGVLSSGKNPTAIISSKSLQVGKKVSQKNSATLTDGKNSKIYKNQLKLGTSLQVPSPSDYTVIGTKVYLGSRKSRIKKNSKNDEFHNLNDFHSSGLNSNDEILPYSKPELSLETEHASGEGKPLNKKDHAEHKWRISQVGAVVLNGAKSLVQRSKQDTANFDREKFYPGSTRRSSYEDDSNVDEYKKYTLISDVASELASTESTESSLHRTSFGSDYVRAYYSAERESGKLEDKSSRVKNSGMVEDTDESQILGVSEKKMQRYEQFADREKSWENKVEKKIDVKESPDFPTVPISTSAKSQIVSDEEQTTESFNELKVEDSLRKNVKEYRTSDNQGKVESDISSGSTSQGESSNIISDKELTWPTTTPSWSDSSETTKNDNQSISEGTHEENFGEDESGSFGQGNESNSDSQETINSSGKTKFNKKLSIELSAVNYAGYNIEGERSDSNIERNPIPKYEIEESYRRTDVARDMIRKGYAAVAVANELAYSDVEYTAAENPGSAVREIGVTDDDGIGLVPAAVSGLDRNGEFIPHTPPPHIIQLESHEIREDSKSRLINDELFKTSWNEIHPRGEISNDKRNNPLEREETLSEISEKISMRNFNYNTNTTNNNDNNNKSELKSLEDQSTDSTEVIGADDHVPRELLKKIAAVTSSRKENEHLGIIETLNGGYLRSKEKKTSVNKGRIVDSGERTTTLNIRATGTPENSFKDNRERSKELGNFQLRKSSDEVKGSELFHEEDISNGKRRAIDGSLRTRVPNFLSNEQDADLEITRPIETELSKMEFSRNSNDTDEFEFLVGNSGPIEDGKIERNGDVEETTIDVRGKSSGNLLSERLRGAEVIRNSKFIVQNSEKLEEDKANKNEDSLLGVKKIEKNVIFDGTRENLTEKKVEMNFRHASSLFESNTDGNTTGDSEININTTLGRTGIIGASAQNELRTNVLAGQKNDEKLRAEENRDGGVSWTMGNKETNLPDKLSGGKPGVVNLSALDISGYGFLTERYLEVDPKNNDRQGKLSGKIVSRPEVAAEGKNTFSKLKLERHEFPFRDSNKPEIESHKFLLGRLNDKYLTSKTKRAMKSSGMGTIPESAEEEKREKVTTVPLIPNSEDKVSKARNISTEKISIAMKNNSETSNFTGLISPPSDDSISKSEETASKSSSQSVQSIKETVDFEDQVFGPESLSRLEDSTEINNLSANESSIFDGDDTPATENHTVSNFSRIITTESNLNHNSDSDVNKNIASRTESVPKILTSSTADLVDQDIPSSLPKNLITTEIPLETTLDISETVTQGLNLPFSFNQTDLDNTSRILTALNQWPVKHSAVVEGDLVLGGLMMVHEREDSITCGPVMPQGGVQALEAMLYTLDRLNQDKIIPGVKIGAHILDDCDKDTYGLEMAVDFIKGSISNIDGAEYHCNKTAVRKVISGVVGAASSVTSIQVANLLRLFRIPQVSFFSTSPELSNKQRFEYFTRTIPSDHYQVKAMVDIVRTMNWSYVSIIYEESNYGIKAFEELEELLAKYNICIAIKEKLVKDSGVAEETAYDNIVQKLLTKPRARGCIIFGSDQEVAGVMRAVRRCNATGAFSWIGSDGWSARGLVSDGNEPEVEGTLSVQPQANPVKGFEEYFLDLTVENNRRNPWFVEFWEDHFQCRYPNASETPYNRKYTNPCTTKERLSKNNTAFEDQLQFVSDAVTAFAYAFRDMHEKLCKGKEGLCDAMKPTKGMELLKYLRNVSFEGLSGDEFRFDKNGDGPARYNIIHFKQVSHGKYKWVRVGEYMEGELRLDESAIQFRLGHPSLPESVCSLPCEVGQAKKYVEGESCCWHCFNCTQYQIRHPSDETQCIPCPQGTVPDETHSHCRDIPEEFLRPESGWAIGAMSFSATGILVTLFVGGVFLRHNDTPVVRASGRELSYVLLIGILLCYLVTFALVLRPNNIVCGIQRFGAGFCFTVVYAALLTKTNRIARIFNAGKQSAKRPSFISPRSQLIICSGLMGIQILINGVWMIIDPAKAMHHYPTREDNLLVCSSYIDASYMIAFTYPIILIVVCTVYAVLTRKIPEAFNESKHIGFTMYTTCVIWLAFVPLYFGTGNHVALRITSMSVTISLSASVTIACLFSPKLYIILIRPERNVRQSMMPARYSTTKSSAVTGTNASSMMAAVTLTAATCDQNKAVKRHVTTTIDCSTQSEYYEMDQVKEDRINGKATTNLISRSTQTQVTDPDSTETNSAYGMSAAAGSTAIINNTKDPLLLITSEKSILKDSGTTTNSVQSEKQLNNVSRIGNGPVSQKDGAL